MEVKPQIAFLGILARIGKLRNYRSCQDRHDNDDDQDLNQCETDSTLGTHVSEFLSTIGISVAWPREYAYWGYLGC